MNCLVFKFIITSLPWIFRIWMSCFISFSPVLKRNVLTSLTLWFQCTLARYCFHCWLETVQYHGVAGQYSVRFARVFPEKPTKKLNVTAKYVYQLPQLQHLCTERFTLLLKQVPKFKRNFVGGLKTFILRTFVTSTVTQAFGSSTQRMWKSF